MNDAAVLTLGDVGISALRAVLGRYKLTLDILADKNKITGSFWGDPEAGVVGTTVFARTDTPIHSLLHETCHIVCMTAERRSLLCRDAGSDDLEESAVCYLQVVLANHIASVGTQRLMQDMDTWGYSFRLGSTKAWFDTDAADARNWLVRQQLLGPDGTITFALRH